MIAIICIIAKNRAIGFNNKLLYDIPEDMKHFKEITLGQTVIMGERTFHSMNGRALPGRINIILTLNKDFAAPDCLVAHSMEESINLGRAQAGRQIFFIGGGQIYKQALPLADKLYLTVVDDEPKQADTFFPDYSEFKTIVSEKTIEASGYKITFLELTR
jgi:dihydrofolate reductase